MNSKFNEIRTAGVLSYVDDLLKVAHAMIDDCRFTHEGEKARIGGEEEQSLLDIEHDIDWLRQKIDKFVKEH